MTVRELLDRFVFVRKCGGCGELLAYEDSQSAFCPTCRLKWKQAKVEPCPVCYQEAVACACMPKGLSATGALSLRKLTFYSPKRMKEPQNQVIYRIKHEPNRRISAFLAGELRVAVKEELKVLEADPTSDALLVFVPRGRKAAAKYGFDQSELICRELSAQTGIPYLPILKRKRGGKEQKKLDKTRRFRNIRSLFYVNPKIDLENIKGKCVFLLDDVVTTGASMAACVHLVKESGAKTVICLCVAQN